MYNYTVPLLNMTFTDDDRESIVKTLRDMCVTRVLLALSTYVFDKNEKEMLLRTISDNTAFLKERGFEVGAWVWTFWDEREKSDFVRMRLTSGNESAQAVCPSDASFRRFAGDYIKDIAKCGVDLIVYDDDFRYGNLAGDMGCLCKNHLAFMSKEVGEPLTLEGVRPYLISGGENKYRSAWQKSKRYYFELFAREMREALDSVRPEVRLGVCSCYPNWDQDGMSTYEISKILAGQTRPYLRLSAGPYWVTQGLAEHRLADIVELTRMELSFCGGDTDAEIVSEGDPHPRPRWSVPAAYLEGFDTALRAAGGLSGMQKYSFDYGASHTYETGYNERHIKNLPLYRKIDEMFGDKTAIGVRVYKSLYEFEKTDIPEYLPDISSLQYSCFPYAARLLSAANIPIVWEGTEGVGVAFGESAKYLSEEAIRSGLIIDARAAEILTERGVDVGLVSKSEHVEVCSEKFVETGERVGVFSSNAYATRAYRIEVRDGARVESYFTLTGTSLLPLYSHSPEKYPSDHIIGSYFYENEDGGKFLVYSFDGTLVHRSIFRHYERANQLKRVLSRLGITIGFTVKTSPDLYVVAKEGDGKIAVGLWNFTADAAEKTEILLSDRAEVLKTICCDAKIEDKKIILSRIEPFGFAAVEFSLT